MAESTKEKKLINSRNDALNAFAWGMLSLNEARAAFGCFQSVYEIDEKANAELDAPDPQWPKRPPRFPKYTNCPNCGAAVNPHKDKCEYCDTYYQY